MKQVSKVRKVLQEKQEEMARMENKVIQVLKDYVVRQVYMVQLANKANKEQLVFKEKLVQMV